MTRYRKRKTPYRGWFRVIWYVYSMFYNVLENVLYSVMYWKVFKGALHASVGELR